MVHSQMGVAGDLEEDIDVVSEFASNAAGGGGNVNEGLSGFDFGSFLPMPYGPHPAPPPPLPPPPPPAPCQPGRVTPRDTPSLSPWGGPGAGAAGGPVLGPSPGSLPACPFLAGRPGGVGPSGGGGACLVHQGQAQG